MMRLNSLLPQISGFSWTNFSAAILIASCPASVTPSVAALPIVVPTTRLATSEGIPDLSSIFSTTPAFAFGPSCLRIATGNTESNAADTEPAKRAAPVSI